MSDSNSPEKWPDASLSGWAMINSQGEIASEDGESDGSESSIEVVSFPEPREHQHMSETTTVHTPMQANPTTRTGIENNGDIGSSLCPEFQADTRSMESMQDNSPCNNHEYPDENTVESTLTNTSGNTHEGENDVLTGPASGIQELGACCAEILKESMEYRTESDTQVPGAIVDSSDTDSEFIRLDSENPEEIENILNAENPEERIILPLTMTRSDSSISQDFNFMRFRAEEMPQSDHSDNEEEYINVDRNLPRPDIGQIIGHVEDNEFDSDGDGLADRDEDTESSAEDSFDDRIESEQSEAGSLNYGNDIVGDLSTVSDFGDIPLVAGDVARNYRHTPNPSLTNILNAVMVLLAILTTGISLGIIMATDLEIEEWHRAYEKEAFKVRALEEQSKTLEKLWTQCKREAVEKNIHIHELEVQQKLDNSHEYLIDGTGKNDTQEDRNVEATHQTVNQENIDSNEPTLPVDETEGAEQLNEEEVSSVIDVDSFERSVLETHHVKRDATPLSVELDMKQLQQSLTREQERALHWQQLFLAERRQRERDREEEELEDERDRERWEQEREESDRLECLQKLVSTNLTTLTQHVLRWNVSVFDDFANLSMLLSTVADLKQSVISSAHKVWEEAEDIFERIGDSVEQRRKYSSEKWESLPNKDELLTYFEQVMKDVKEEVEEAFKDKVDSNDFKDKLKGDFSSKSKQSKEFRGTRKRIGRFSNLIKKTKVSVKKLGKKLVGFLGKMQNAWEDRQKWFSKVGNLFHKDKSSPIESKFNELCIGSKEAIVRSEMDFHINVMSQCMSFIRSSWQKNVFDNECYDGECYKHSKKAIENSKHLSSQFENLLKTKIVKPKDIGSISSKYTSNMKFMFGDFVTKWSSSNLILGIDMTWAKCQLRWWENAHVFILQNKKQNKETIMGENSCQWVKLPEKTLTDDMNSLEIMSALQYRLVLNYEHGPNRNTKYPYVYDNEDDNDHNQYFSKREYDEEDTGNYQSKNNNEALFVEIDSAREIDTGAKHLDLHQVDDNKTKFSNQLDQGESSDVPDRLYLERARAHLEAKRDKEKAASLTSDKDGRFNLKLSSKNINSPSGEWQFKKANERELRRKEEHQSDWMFERAHGRRENADDATYTVYKTPGNKNKRNWYVEQGKDRENLRRLDHQSDWMFERAHDRASYHKNNYKDKDFKAKKHGERRYKEHKTEGNRFRGDKSCKDSHKFKRRSQSCEGF